MVPGNPFSIVFYPGTHGNFLCFVLNKCLLGDKFPIDNPFDSIGTSHGKIWEIDWSVFSDQPHFRAYHQFEVGSFTENDKIIKIDFSEQDDMFVIPLLLKRGNSGNIDVEDICDNTYHKLKNQPGPEVKLIIDHINRYTDITPYFNIKDKKWPDIKSVDDFYQLPKEIVKECIDVFGFRPVELTPLRPDCPRWVMRSLFKNWLKGRTFVPSNEIKFLDKFSSVYKFDLYSFYNFFEMKNEIKNIGQFFNLNLDIDRFTQTLHHEFVSNVPFVNTKADCQKIFQAIKEQQDIPIKLNVFCEAYLDYLLEDFYNVEMPLHHETYFVSSSKVTEYINGILLQGGIHRLERT